MCLLLACWCGGNWDTTGGLFGLGMLRNMGTFPHSPQVNKAIPAGLRTWPRAPDVFQVLDTRTGTKTRMGGGGDTVSTSSFLVLFSFRGQSTSFYLLLYVRCACVHTGVVVRKHFVESVFFYICGFSELNAGHQACVAGTLSLPLSFPISLSNRLFPHLSPFSLPFFPHSPFLMHPSG